MRKMEIMLKDDFEVVEDGATYIVPIYKATSEGLKEVMDTGKKDDPFQNQIINFVRAENNLNSANVGTLHEHLLKVMIYDLKIKNQHVRSRETYIAITKMEEAYNVLLQRQIDRTDREVIGTTEEKI